MKTIRQLAFEACKEAIYEQHMHISNEKIKVVSDAVVDAVEYSIEDEIRRENAHLLAILHRVTVAT